MGPVAFVIVFAAVLAPLPGLAQSSCPPTGWSIERLRELKASGFKIADRVERNALATRLDACLRDPNPEIRDGIAFEALSTLMRNRELDVSALRSIGTQLAKMVVEPDPAGFGRPFAILTLAEVARTDRLDPWMDDAERERMVSTAASYLASLTDYRAFNDREGFRHGVAHGADFALQLALNPAISKLQLDRLLESIATQVTPKDPSIAYWAGESDRLARPVIFIAQRRLHTDAEWKSFFERVMSPAPLASWEQAFSSERGIRKHHNVRAFLLSMFANASTSDDAGIRQLVSPIRAALQSLP